MAWFETLGRIPKIIESNVNAVLDKCQDPTKMSKQMLADYKSDLAKVKEATTEMMADLDIAKKNYLDAQARVQKLSMNAMNAVKANDRAAAELIVAEKQKAEVAMQDYKKIYDNMLQQANQMKAGYNKLVQEIQVLEAAANRTAAKENLARAVERSNKAMSRMSTTGMTDSFASMEAAADRRLAKANAMRTIDDNISDADAIIAKYDTGAGPSVSTEVDQLFAAMAAAEEIV